MLEKLFKTNILIINLYMKSTYTILRLIKYTYSMYVKIQKIAIVLKC